MATEDIPFKTSNEYKRWIKNVNKGKWLHYDRVPVGKQIWTYGDGHTEYSEFGKYKGTFLSNLSFIISTLEGRLEGGDKDRKLVDAIDTRGGVTVTFDWGE